MRTFACAPPVQAAQGADALDGTPRVVLASDRSQAEERIPLQVHVAVRIRALAALHVQEEEVLAIVPAASVLERQDVLEAGRTHRVLIEGTGSLVLELGDAEPLGSGAAAEEEKATGDRQGPCKTLAALGAKHMPHSRHSAEQCSICARIPSVTRPVGIHVPPRLAPELGRKTRPRLEISRQRSLRSGSVLPAKEPKDHALRG